MENFQISRSYGQKLKTRLQGAPSPFAMLVRDNSRTILVPYIAGLTRTVTLLVVRVDGTWNFTDGPSALSFDVRNLRGSRYLG